MVDKYPVGKNNREVGLYYLGLNLNKIGVNGMVSAFSPAQNVLFLNISAEKPLKIRDDKNTTIDGDKNSSYLFDIVQTGDIIYMFFDKKIPFLATKIFFQKTGGWFRAIESGFK